MRRYRLRGWRLLIGVAIVPLAGGWSVGHASAGTRSEGFTDGGGVTIGAGNTGGSGGEGGGDGSHGGSGRGGGGGGPTPTCSSTQNINGDIVTIGQGISQYTLADPASQAILSNPTGDDSNVHAGQQGAWYVHTCDGVYAGMVWFSSGSAPGGPVIDPAALAQEAFQNIPFPAPSIRMAPDLGLKQLVRMPTWLWLDATSWAPKSGVVSAPGVTVTATGTPTRVIWDMGNGDQVTCNGPGVPYDTSRPFADQSTDCSYTYTHTSASQPGEAYVVTATVEWSTTWTAAGAAGGGSLPVVQRSASVPVRVQEVQVLNR